MYMQRDIFYSYELLQWVKKQSVMRASVDGFNWRSLLWSTNCEGARAVIANRMPAGTEVLAKDFLGAREDFLQIS
jgi:hypothetical protein